MQKLPPFQAVPRQESFDGPLIPSDLISDAMGRLPLPFRGIFNIDGRSAMYVALDIWLEKSFIDF